MEACITKNHKDEVFKVDIETEPKIKQRGKTRVKSKAHKTPSNMVK
jgi:hypothetical protein